MQLPGQETRYLHNGASCPAATETHTASANLANESITYDIVPVRLLPD